MKYLSFAGMILAAGPALAHEGLHVTPHGAEWVPVFLGLSVIGLAGVIALRTRVAEAKTTGRRK